METILVADYGREDLLGLGSPVVSALRALGYGVIEAKNHLDVLAQARAVHPEAVLLYDTLPEVEALHHGLSQEPGTQSLPILLLHEQVQQMRFTDMVVVEPQHRLGTHQRQFHLQELQRLLDATFPPRPAQRAPAPIQPPHQAGMPC